MRIVGTGRREDDIALLHRQHLAGYAQRAVALQNDEHLLLRVMQMVGADPLAFAGSQFAIGRRHLAGQGSGRETHQPSFIERRAPDLPPLPVIDIPDQLGGKVGGAVGHPISFKKAISASLTSAARSRWIQWPAPSI